MTGGNYNRGYMNGGLNGGYNSESADCSLMSLLKHVQHDR